MYKILLSFFFLIFALKSFAYGLGNFSLPLEVADHVLSVDATGFFNNVRDVGMQARYTRRMGELFTLDAGLGHSFGKRGLNAFVGADLEIFPDYMEQPRFSVKTSIELTDIEEADDSEKFAGKATAISMAPSVSKMLEVADMTIYPYLALPIGLNLFDKYDVYEANLALSLGLSSWVTIGGADNVQEKIGPLSFNAELRVGLSKADTLLMLGVGWKLP